VVQRIIKVVSRELALKIEKLEGVENVECKSRLRPIERSREPRGRYQLITRMCCSNASTKSKTDGVDAANIHHSEILYERIGVRAGGTLMA
jgi:hypothetical protein